MTLYDEALENLEETWQWQQLAKYSPAPSIDALLCQKHLCPSVPKTCSH
jgi:hypothetical protein